MVTVYRVETVDGVGPHTYKFDVGYRLSYAADTLTHPIPFDDFSCGGHSLGSLWEADAYDRGLPISDYYFGFTTMDMLMSWFYNKNDRRLLREAGYQVSIYTCPDDCVINSKKQAVFIKKWAVLISHEPLVP